MVRRARVEYPGAVYHVIQRGNNRENVFERPEYKEYLVDQFRKSVAVDGIELFAYVVMGNHFHLALRTCAEPLRKVMHRINTRYSLYYNRVMERTGHVFEGRYKAIPVDNEKYLISLVKYIHRNPVRAGICPAVRDYPWSGDRFYREMESGFVEIRLLLDMLSVDRAKSVREYSILMEQDDNYSQEDVTQKKSPEGSEKPKKYATGRKPLNEILMETGVAREDFELIKRGSRLRRLSAAKETYAKTAWEQGYSLEEIARYICISAVAVYKYVNRPNEE
ncbi:MAG: REP-associated tyrosine transposase [Bacillota bacterium]